MEDSPHNHKSTMHKPTEQRVSAMARPPQPTSPLQRVARSTQQYEASTLPSTDSNNSNSTISHCPAPNIEDV